MDNAAVKLQGCVSVSKGFAPMLKAILIVIMFFAPVALSAQTVVSLCTNQIANGKTVCIPVSTSAPLPTKSN